MSYAAIRSKSRARSVKIAMYRIALHCWSTF